MPPDVPPLRPMDAVTTPGGLLMEYGLGQRVGADLEQHGWKLVPTVAWQFGEVETSEGLYIQDDGIVMAVMQRLHPPLKGVEFDRMSDIFNSTQMVRDVESTLAFLKLLGFERFIHHAGPLPGDGSRVLQLEEHPLESASIHLSIAHPEAVMSGSIELIECRSTRCLFGRPREWWSGYQGALHTRDDIDATLTAIDNSEGQPSANRFRTDSFLDVWMAKASRYGLDGGRLDYTNANGVKHG